MFRAPSQAGLPPLQYLLADIPASTGQIARHLGIPFDQMAAYHAKEEAPRPVMLALFWESRWGRSAADVDATNHAAHQFQRAAALERENAALRRQVARLESELAAAPTHRAANAPIWAS